MCSAQKNRLHKVLVDAGIRINVVVADIHGASARAMVKALIADKPMHEVLDCKGRLRASREELFEALSTEQFSAVHCFVADEIMQHIEQLEQRIARLDQYLLEGLWPWQPQLELLQTLPGIDEQGAAMLLVEIGADMSVFGSAERLASWVGICPGNNESAGKRKTGRIRKGNAWVRRLLCEFAQAAARTRCALKAKFDALAIRKGHKKSVVALAHKMLRTVYAMLANGTHYQDKEIDYEALNVQRNAPRWIKMLRKHGYIPHVVSRPKEAAAKRRNPAKKARRWVVEVCHSWFNRFRKLLVRYEKLERSFVALNHIAAAIIAFRKVKLSVNIIYNFLVLSVGDDRAPFGPPFEIGAAPCDGAVRKSHGRRNLFCVTRR